MTLFSGRAIFRDCQGAMWAWGRPVFHSLVLGGGMGRAVMSLGCGGAHGLPQELLVGRTCCGEPGQESLWGFHRGGWNWPENMRKSTALSVRLAWSQWNLQVGVRQPNPAFRVALPWPKSATVALGGVLSLNSMRGERRQHWMLLYFWLCLRRDRSFFTFTSLYYNKALHKGT